MSMAPSLIFLILASLINYISSEGTGKVYIGECRNCSTSNTKLYIWPFYQMTGFLPISVYVRNDSTGSNFLDLTENVTIHCEQNPSSIGFSLVEFSPLYLIAPNTEGNVSLQFLRPGRPIDVRCFGISYPLPENSSNLNHNPQFLKDTSISKPRILVIKRSPVVNICNQSIIVPLIQQPGNITGTFTIMFSEVTASSVFVICGQTHYDSDTMQILFGNQTAPNNSKSFEISYTILKLGSPVKVFCEATGKQYLPMISRGYPTIFQQNQLFLDFHPSTLKVKNLSFQVYLSYNTLTFEDILNTIIHCNVVTVNCSQDIAAVSNCFPVSSLASNALDTGGEIQEDISDSVWKLQERIFKINNGPFYKALQLKRTNIVKVDTKETVKINCFVTSMPNISATFSAAVSLKPFVEYNISSINLNLERGVSKMINPTSKNFAPCPCDLKAMMCDIDCCCDSDCKELQEFNLNQCIFKENIWKMSSDHMCNAENSSGLNILFCVVSKENVYLGIYYNDKTSISTPTSFTEIWSESRYSYTGKKPHQSSLGERHGNLVNKELKVTTNMLDVLVLPQTIFNGQCITSAPLPFLIDITSHCTYYVDNNICSNNSALSAMSYVLSTSLINFNCPLSDDQQHDIVPIDVNYYCTENVNFYIKNFNSSTNVWKEELNKSMNCLFNETYCSNNNDNVLERRCDWDDSYTRPPIPLVRRELNEIFCDNVVLSVSYQFIWNGTKIIFLNASIVLGNISLSEINRNMDKKNESKMYDSRLSPNRDITHLTQHYKVHYVNIHNKSDSKIQYTRSGNPGYLPGRPVYSGVAILNNTFLFVDQNSSQQISVWNPVPSGICDLGHKRRIMFGENIYSSCFFPVKQLNNCQTLRKDVLNVLNQMVPADRIGRYGNSHAKIKSHWIKILRQNISRLFSDSKHPTTNINDNFNQTYINHSTLSATQSTKFESSSCDLLPVGINLNIMYAHTGYVHGAVIHEIIGAKMRYAFGKWIFHCNEFQSASCFLKPQTKDDLKLFTLSVAVNFVPVPATKPLNLIKVYDLEKAPPWKKLLYPLEIPQTLDEFAYNLTIYLIFLFISLLTITQSWSLLDF